MNTQQRFGSIARRLTLGLLAALTLGLFGQAQDTTQRTQPWSDEVIKLFGSLPVQHGGRVKPLKKLAGLDLLIFNGKRTLELEDGSKLKQTPWLLDCYFFPEMARDYPSFRVQNDTVLERLGVDTQANDKRKSDRYSYNELAPHRQNLMERAISISEIPPREQNPVDAQTIKLATDLRAFESLIGTLDPVRWKYAAQGTGEFQELFGSDTATLTQIVEHSKELLNGWRRASAQGDGGDKSIGGLLPQLESVLDSSQGAAAFLPPPSDFEDQDTWWRFHDLVKFTFEQQTQYADVLPMLAAFQQLEQNKNDPSAFLSTLEGLHKTSSSIAEARGEYGTIPLEITLEGVDPFTKALVSFLLGFLLSALGWLIKDNKWLGRAVWTCALIGLGFGIWGITMRCLIRHRPPVVSLYDTVIFITCVCVLVGVVSEYLTRQRIGLAVSTFLGTAGMFLANKYEFIEVKSAGDTMASVVAVLDTNYYLAIHVTAVTMGYAGGLLAAGIAHVWILGKLFRLREGDTQFYKTILRMTYGVLCFSLLFAIFGTIMGGVWANDSWGRFWGWDPKENGALLICIWQLLCLHMRMGGFVKDRGFVTMVVAGGGVVAASWWGVNLLEVGLHSYGFTSGAGVGLLIYWGIEVGVIGLSGLDKITRRSLPTA